MTEGRLQILGIIVTVLLHIGLGTALALMEKNDEEEHSLLRELDENVVVIEASLAFKSKDKKSRQPQKKKAPPPVKPTENLVTRDADAKPAEPDKKPDPKEVDVEAVLDKHRNVDLSEDGGETGEEVPQLGSPDGSEWGTATEAKGDPYVGEIHGRIKKVWAIPTLETQTGEALGCVRLSPDGKIADRTLWKKSGIANLDRSVNEALRAASDMEEPVPAHLIFLLTKKGICFRFKLEG